jgi:hypothetical protein
MRLENQGLTLWCCTPDTPWPASVVTGDAELCADKLLDNVETEAGAFAVRPQGLGLPNGEHPNELRDVARFSAAQAGLIS